MAKRKIWKCTVCGIEDPKVFNHKKYCAYCNRKVRLMNARHYRIKKNGGVKNKKYDMMRYILKTRIGSYLSVYELSAFIGIKLESIHSGTIRTYMTNIRKELNVNITYDRNLKIYNISNKIKNKIQIQPITVKGKKR